MAIAPTTPAITPSLEFASTSSSSVRTTSGTSADLDTEYVFCSTSTPNTSGNSRTSSTWGIISSSSSGADHGGDLHDHPPAAGDAVHRGPISGRDDGERGDRDQQVQQHLAAAARRGC